MRTPWLLGGLSTALALAALAVSIFALTLARQTPEASASKSNPTDYTVALVEQAVAFYEANGRQAAIDYYNSPESVDGSWYVYIFDENKNRIAHPTRPDLLGTPVNGPTAIDVTGYYYGEIMAQTPEAGHWVDYVFLNPDTGRQQAKHSWLVLHDGLTFGAGWYEDTPVRTVSRSNPTDYTVAFVQKAVAFYRANGRQATLDYYNSPDSADGQWYMFIVDENNNALAHTNPAIIGRNLVGDLGTDVNGYQFGEVMSAATGQGLWVDYFFLNPATGNQEFKHSYVERHDGLLFGSGWYQVFPRSLLIPSREDPAEYTVAFVDNALRYYKAHGRDKALEYFNSMESTDGRWYVFVVDEAGLAAANAPNPDLLGEDLRGELGTDVNGKRFGIELLAATEEGHWVDYEFRVPGSDQTGSKHSWAVRYDGLIFGSGWYE